MKDSSKKISPDLTEKIDRISPKLVEKVKAIPLDQFLPVRRTRRGSGYEMFSCPFHQDKRPSMAWYKKSNTFYCFSCGEHGDNISFIMKLCKVSFQNAVLYLEKYL